MHAWYFPTYKMYMLCLTTHWNGGNETVGERRRQVPFPPRLHQPWLAYLNQPWAQAYCFCRAMRRRPSLPLISKGYRPHDPHEASPATLHSPIQHLTIQILPTPRALSAAATLLRPPCVGEAGRSNGPGDSIWSTRKVTVHKHAGAIRVFGTRNPDLRGDSLFGALASKQPPACFGKDATGPDRSVFLLWSSHLREAGGGDCRVRKAASPSPAQPSPSARQSCCLAHMGNA